MLRALFNVVTNAAALRRAIVGMGLTAALQGVGFVLLVPLLQALIEGDTGRAAWWLLAMTVALLAFGLLRYSSQLQAFHAAIDGGRALFGRLGDKVASLPLGWFDTDRVGGLGRVTGQGVVDVMGVPAHLLRPLVNAFVTPIVVLLVMIFFDWRLALAMAVSLPVAWVVLQWASNLTKNAEHTVHHASAEAASRTVEFSQTQAVLRSCGRTVDGFAMLDDALMARRNAGRALMMKAVPGLIAFSAVIQVAFVVLLVVGVAIAVGATVDVPELVAVLILAVRFVEPLVIASDISGAIKIAGNSLGRADDVLATPLLPEPAASAEPADGSVAFDGVTFGYGDEPVIDDVSFTVPSGSMTALVGPSGSGKTTIARLVARFWDVDAGSVTIGGVDVRAMTTADLISRVSIVFQENYLFAGTIADNVRLARPEASQAELDEVAALTRLDEVIERLPSGWDSPVGEGGTRLSGGERQRVTLARALLKDADVVVLDEATAAIDPANEQVIQDAIESLRGRRTLLVIAHRLSTIAAADQILVLGDGRLAEQGTHDELLAADGRYASFWRQRERAAGWRLEPMEVV
ncbi:MAG: ABC transporter ATP-binding protein [Actinomycetota bacterium]